MPASLTPSDMETSMPESTDALLALGDVAFVKAAYLTLLCREPDEQGLWPAT